MNLSRSITPLFTATVLCFHTAKDVLFSPVDIFSLSTVCTAQKVVNIVLDFDRVI
mgnify:CR=1 FL=1